MWLLPSEVRHTLGPISLSPRSRQHHPAGETDASPCTTMVAGASATGPPGAACPSQLRGRSPQHAARSPQIPSPVEGAQRLPHSEFPVLSQPVCPGSSLRWRWREGLVGRRPTGKPRSGRRVDAASRAHHLGLEAGPDGEPSRLVDAVTGNDVLHTMPPSPWHMRTRQSFPPRIWCLGKACHVQTLGGSSSFLGKHALPLSEAAVGTTGEKINVG